MKIVVVSDSHGNKSRLDEVLLANQDADLFWHLGDYELPEYLMSPFMLIKGNCDFFSDSPISKDLIINDVKFHLEHSTTQTIYTCRILLIFLLIIPLLHYPFFI